MVKLDNAGPGTRLTANFAVLRGLNLFDGKTRDVGQLSITLQNSDFIGVNINA